MKHGIKKRKFGRTRKQRIAMMNELARGLILHGRIETTEARAKELRPIVEKLVTRGKSDTLLSRRLLMSRLNNNDVAVKKLIDEVSPKYKDREGGYTRITKTGVRSSDAAPRAVIEFV